jgi:hypothetical protein
MRKDDFETVMKECNEELEARSGSNGENVDGGDIVPEQSVEPKALLLRGTMYFLMGDGPNALKDFTACIEHPDSTLKVR